MNRSFLIGVLSMLLVAGLAEAQTSELTPSTPDKIPPGPLVITKLPHFAQWTIDYTYANAPKPGMPSLKSQRPVRVIMTRTGVTIHEETTFEQGLQGEIWSNDRFVVEKSPNLKPIATLQLGGGDDFPDFDWVARDNFVGTQSLEGRKCLVFSKKQFTSTGDFLGMAHAYVDFTSRLPVQYELPSETQKYTIQPPPSEELSLPDDIIAAAKAMVTQVQRATPHLAPP